MLAALTGLTSLNLWNNNISAEGARALAALTDLTILDLGHNSIGAEGARALAALTGLSSLDLRSNRIGADGARALATLTGLTYLNLGNNDIGDDGAFYVQDMTRLVSLELSNTGITQAFAFMRLRQLRMLNINGCHLAHEMPALWKMENSRTVYLANGAIRGVPSEVLSANDRDNCLPRLRAHIEDLLASDCDGSGGGHAVEDVKLMILGNGNAGKTQICRRMRGEPFDETVPSTHGIQVTSALLSPDDEGNPITLRIWDFGGQDIYHGTHALFLKSRAVFPLVWSADTTDHEEHVRAGQRFRNYPLDYWLAYVKDLGGRQSPVLVVQTKVDAPAERRSPPLPEDWTNGLDWHAVVDSSAANARGVVKFQHELTEAVHWLRRTQGVSTIGGGRAAVKAQIEAMQKAGRQVLSLDEFRAMCEADGRISSPELFLDFLHTSGTVFYRAGLFGHQIILDQEWALRAVYAVFDREKSHKQLLRAGGRFDQSLLGALVWDAEGHSEKDQKQFIDFMRASGMCFKLRDASEGFEAEYVAPDLLPDRTDPSVQAALAAFPSETAAATGAITFALLPHGLLRTVMAAIGDKAGRAGTYWRDGFSFYDEETKSRALVEQAWDANWAGEIRVQTHGGDAAALLARVMKLIEDRTERFGARPTGKSTSLDRMEPAERGRASHPMAYPIQYGAPDRDPVLAFKPVHQPTAQAEYYVSYAWGDDTPEGRAREKVVDDFCAAAEARGVRVIRDKVDMKLGDRISAFMGKLAQGDRVFIFLSDKYLKSAFCVTELTEVWRECRQRPAEFSQRARVYVLPSADIASAGGRAQRSVYWRQKYEELVAVDKAHGSLAMSDADNLDYRRMSRWWSELPNILKDVQDTLRPQSFDDFVAHALEGLDRSIM